MHCEWADKPYSCEGHPLNEAGKPIGNRNVLFSSEFCVFKHESSCSHNKAYLCRVVGDMTSVKVRCPPSKGSDTGLDEWNSKEYFLKRLQSGVEWLTNADFNAIARDQNLRNLNTYVFSTDVYSQICCIIFPGEADLGVQVCGECVAVKVPRVLVSGHSVSFGHWSAIPFHSGEISG